MRFKNLKNALFLSSLVLIGLTSCSKDNALQLPVVNIESSSAFENHVVSMPQDEVLKLSAGVKSLSDVATVLWTVNGVQKSTANQFDFSSAEVGDYVIKLAVTNYDGTTTDSLKVSVYGKYRDGTFVLNEGNMTSENGFLTFISNKGVVTDSAYYKVNGTFIGNTTQDLFIANKKLYVIAQNGNRMGGDGTLVVANAETLKKEAVYNDELSKLSWPTHLAVVDNNVYIRDNAGVYVFNTDSKSLSFIDGTDGALKNTMAVVGGKVFVPSRKAVLILQNGKLLQSVAMPGAVSGVVKSKDGNVWVSCTTSPAQIIKMNSSNYSLTSNELPTGVRIGAGWGATSGISAKGDTIYFSNASSKVYRHIFSAKQTELLTDVKPLIANFGMLYNNLAVNPATGNIYITTIKGYGMDFLINDITVWQDAGTELKMVSDYKNYIHFPAGTFFTENFK